MAKKIVDQSSQCKYCGKIFKQQKTLSTHICVKKRRYQDSNLAGNRYGLRTFQRFFEIASSSEKIKTLDDFINSDYYVDFVKFGNYLAILKPVYPDQFIDYVIRGGLKIKDWTKEEVYDLYIDQLIKKEPATSATDRSISEIIGWCESNNVIFEDFFTAISPNEATSMIRRGKISPWVLYLCNSGGNLLSRFNEDHAKVIQGIIDAGFWMKKFKKLSEDVVYIKEILRQAGL